MDANKPNGAKQIKKEAISVMRHIERIVDLTKDKKFTSESIEACSEHTTALAERLSITAMQALLLSVFIDQCYDESIRINDLAGHFDCRNINIMCYSEDIDSLVAKGYIRKRKQNRQTAYRVPEEVVAALKKGVAYAVPSLEGLTIRKFFDELGRLFDEREGKELSFRELQSKTDELISCNPHLQICKAIGNYPFEDEDLVLLLFFCHKFINDNDDGLGPWDMKNIYDSKGDFNSTEQDLKHNCHTLQIFDAVESKKDDDLVSRDIYCLTDKAKQELLSELNLDIKEQAKPKNIILAKDVVEKPLYYNAREQGQIDQLVSLLDTEHFSKVQKRLSKNGMRKGFACLFYGSPGTGKTETVYQVARRTGRDIMYVNVSEIKSMWVGESEKNMKALFDRYRNFTKQSADIPILLFNEADAVIGIRKQGAEHAVDKMENSIQNIILQEMETLDGIMIATTNLTQNLDPAFERRFLFKIEFDKPGIEAKTAIWRSMIPGLSKSDSEKLAGAYDFSGGQIENIARKRTVDHIIQGKRPGIDMIHGYCKSELINNGKKERRPIGF